MNIRHTELRSALVCSLILLAVATMAVYTYAQVESPEDASTQKANWLVVLNSYTKVVGAVLTGLGTLFGLPVVILNFRKTRAEIRKLELESASLESKAAVKGDIEAGTSIRIQDSNHVNVQVLADPRFLGPLLLLLDFILAWIVLTLAGYFLGIFGLGFIRSVLLVLLAAVLLIPIAREARRVRVSLRPQESGDHPSRVEEPNGEDA